MRQSIEQPMVTIRVSHKHTIKSGWTPDETSVILSEYLDNIEEIGAMITVALREAYAQAVTEAERRNLHEGSMA